MLKAPVVKQKSYNSVFLGVHPLGTEKILYPACLDGRRPSKPKNVTWLTLEAKIFSSGKHLTQVQYKNIVNRTLKKTWLQTST